jgi:hypothetical protein
LEVLFLMALGVPLGLAMVFYLRHHAARTTAAWGSVARRHGLRLLTSDHSPPSLFGDVKGRPCSVHVDTGGEDDPPTAHISLAAGCAPDFSLTLRPAGLVTWLEERLGASELEVGDGPFDRRFCVRTSASERTRRLLDRPTREALLDADFDELVFEDDKIAVVVRASTWGGGIVGLAPRVDRSLRAALRLAGRADVQGTFPLRLQAEESTSYRAPARSAASIVTVATVLLLVGLGVGLVRWLDAHKEREAAAFASRVATIDLAGEILGLASERARRDLVRPTSPAGATLLATSADGRALLERERAAEAERAAAVAAEPARVDELRARYRALRARQPDPAAFDLAVGATVREMAKSVAGVHCEQVLREIAPEGERVASARSPR